VTSDLARFSRKADHRQGVSGIRQGLKKARKLFEIKILTPNSYALKILQTIFAKPAPVKAFRGMGGRGYTSKRNVFPKRNPLKCWFQHAKRNIFLRSFPHPAENSGMSRQLTQAPQDSPRQQLPDA